MTTSVAVKPPCRVQTTAAITLSGEQTVNGVAVVTGDRVLVKDQADNTTNGIYIADTSAWSRAPDFDGSLDAVDGTLVLVHAASGPDQLYELSATNPVIIGTSALTFSLSSLTATAFGASLIAAADAAAARLLLGFSTFFSTLIAAADAAALRVLLGATVVGSAVFTAIDAAAARLAIGATESGANSTITSLTGLTTGVSGRGLGSKIQPIDYTLSGNALTLKLDPTTLDFRSTTLTSGAVTTVSNAAQITTTISSGSTGGTINAVSSDIIILAINNAGTMELAWTNLAGGLNLDETGLISTTAEGGAGGADSATTIYSTTARANVAYRVVGVFRSTQTTAGTWAQNPALVQGVGGEALAAMASIGYGQTWQSVIGSRAMATTYYNQTGKPIQVSVSVFSTASANITLTVSGVVVATETTPSAGVTSNVMAIVPPGASYSVGSDAGTPTINNWVELR